MMKMLLLTAALLATAASADEPTVYRLSPEEAAKAQASASTTRPPEYVFDTTLPLMERDRKIHGEVGMGIGTGGYSDIFGTAVIPLGDSSTAILSFEQSRLDRRRYRPF